MKAVILAGGRGTRLHPLTQACPKPMARLCGRPVLEYIIELLAENGVEECALTLQFLPEQITSHFPAERFAGVKLRFCMEEEPLGTAGGARLAAGSCRETLLVISGDALCDFPLKKAVQQHLDSGAAATIVAARVEDPREYGLVLADRRGMVEGFIEKPSYSQATGGLANTGIYILSPRALDMIPQGEKFDFAADLFPKMLAAGVPLFCCPLDGYWCDIGDLEAYRKAQADLLTGKVRCRLRGARDAQGNLLSSRRPAGKYELVPPVYIGDGVQIGDGAVVSAGSVLDDGCTVSPGATVDASILLPRSTLGSRAGVLSSVIGRGAAVQSRATLLEGAAIGDNASIGARALVRGGVRVSAGAKVPDGTVISDHVTARSGQAQAFDDEGLCGEIGVELTPELAVRVGCAVGTLARGRTVGVASGEERGARVLADALIAGARSAGAAVLDFGGIFEAMFGFAMGYNGLELGVYLSGGDCGAIKLVCNAGLPATRKMEREIELLLSRAEFSRAARDGFGDRIDLSGIGMLYLTSLLRLAPDGLSGMAATVSCGNRTVSRMLTSALQKLGCDTSGGIGLSLSDNGARLTLTDGPVTIDPRRAVAAYCMTLFEQGKDAAVENDFPRALDLFAQQRGRRVYRYLLCPADNSDEQGRKLAAQQQCARDGLMLSVLLLDYMRRAGLTLEALERRLPGFAVEERSVPVDLPPARLLDGLASAERAGEGMLVRGERGVVLLRPRKNGSAIRVFAEASNWETAHEICLDFTNRLGSLLDKQHGNG